MLEGIYFKDPIFLWLLLFVPIIIVWHILTEKKAQPILRISSVEGFKKNQISV